MRVTVIFPGAIGTNIAANSGVAIRQKSAASTQQRSSSTRFYRLSPQRAADFIFEQMKALLPG